MQNALFNRRICSECLIGGLNLIMSLHLLGAEPKPAESQLEPVTFQSTERKTTLLELFTSEGCSSCPPAEAWLSRLKASPRLWKDFVPVAFHVNYWDYLGWRDPWGSQAFSERQRRYAQAWQSENVYTPGFVLDGREWQSWSTHKNGPVVAGSRAGVLKVTSSDAGRWQVEFTSLQPIQGGYEVHAAILAAGLTSDISAGENRGRRLVHDFVALELTLGLLQQNGKEATGQFSFSEHLRRQGRLALAVWITAPGLPEPLQATGGWLPPR